MQLERILAEDTRQVVKLAEKPLPLTGAASDFELYAPGMIVFAILLLIPQTAMLVGREVREGTMTRLRLSRLGAAEWLGGLTLSQMIVAVGQVLLTFAAAAVFGFRCRGSLLLAVGIGLMLGLSAVGMGLVVGRFSRSDSDAINVGSVFTMLQVFLSGSFFAMPGSTLLRMEKCAAGAVRRSASHAWKSGVAASDDRRGGPGVGLAAAGDHGGAEWGDFWGVLVDFSAVRDLSFWPKAGYYFYNE